MRSVRLSLFFVTVMGFLSTCPAMSQGVAPWEYWRNTPVPITDFGTATSSLTITDVFTITSLQVMVDIDHEASRDLRIVLRDPAGTPYTLSNNRGGVDPSSGDPYDDFDNTIFENTATTGNALPGIPISGVLFNGRFNGVYVPESTLPTSGGAAGTWTLEVTDGQVGNEGTLTKWGLIFNRYGNPADRNYKDVRWGWDLNAAGLTADRYPTAYLLIDDVTPIPPYTVFGYRPQANQISFVSSFQNGKQTSATNVDQRIFNPTGGLHQSNLFEVSLPRGDYYVNGTVSGVNTAGDYHGVLTLSQRTDLYQTRDDNTYHAMLHVTAGSLGYDNNDLANTLEHNPGNMECNGAVFTINADQTMTSVDIWHGTAPEGEPVPIPNYGSIRVYTSGGTLLYNFGPYPLPIQGTKWVTYPVPPTLLAAGSYIFSLCVENQPTVGGVGLGVDQAANPYTNEGFTSRYSGFGTQVYSLDDGASWNEDVISFFTTKKIRPNFILNSDVGVVSIDAPPAMLPGSFQPKVTFGAFAHHPYLPNLLMIGRLQVIDSATGNVVRESERRVFLTNVTSTMPAPYAVTTQVTFDNISGLPSGTYYIKASIERADDENLVNNSYQRVYHKTAAPIVVSHDGSLSYDRENEIRAELEGMDQQVTFVNRNFETLTFPANGQMLWIGEINDAEAQRVREFVEGGNYFAVIGQRNDQRIDRTQVLSNVATTVERENMNNMLAKASQSVMDIARDREARVIDLNATAPISSLGQFDQMEAAAGPTERYFETVKANQRTFGNGALTRDMKSVRPTRTQDYNVSYNRLGNLVVAEVTTSKVVYRRGEQPVTVSASDFELSQNYPNPFNPSTTILYNLTEDASVSLRVYDLLGREVATLVNTMQNAGRFTVVWDGRSDDGVDAASGIYMYRMEAQPLNGGSAFVSTKKMILNR